MQADLMKAGFILIASTGFLIFSLSSKKNLKKILKLFIKQKKKKEDVIIGI
jgi:hypothetical protein